MNLKYLVGCWTALMVCGLIWGQPQQQDPPSRVARLNYINTNLSFRPGSQEEWAPATLNYPVTTGDHLWSDQSGGAEMHVGENALRVAGGTSFAVLNLDDKAMQVSVSQGFINVRLRRLDQGETFEVDTPNGAISLLGPGDYRVDVNGDANMTMVTVRDGQAEMNGAGQTFPVNAGQQVRFTGADQLNAQASQIGGPDQWDQWCATRDQKDEAAEQQVAPYVGPNMIGAEDLVNYGQWRTDPTYGAYWVPQVAPDWAPYRVGHWAYVEPWGWTWIDDAPWGFAPFHYGRWAFVGGAWGWFPGAIVVRPVYAPAMVAFVGGGGFVAAVGVGVAAWVPLGPAEVFTPYYHVSDVYVRNVNITSVNVTNINVTNVNYVNRSYVTAVRQDTFVGAHSVRSGFVRVPPSAYGHMERANAGNFHPAREAYLGRRMEGAHVVTPPHSVVDRPVVVNHTPPSIAGRPAVASYRQAPPVTRHMEVGSQGHYQPAAVNRTPANFPSRTNAGVPPNRTQPNTPRTNQASLPNRNPVQQQQQRAPVQQQRPVMQQQQRPVTQQQQRPVAQQQQRPVTQQQQRPVMQQQQQRPPVQQQRPVVQQQQQRPNIQQQQQQQRPVVQQQRPNIQQQQQRPVVPQQHPAVPPPPPRKTK